MMILRTAAPALVLLVGAAGPVAAQDQALPVLERAFGIPAATPSGPVSSGRPSVSTGPTTLTRGYAQLEGGLSFTRDDDAESYALPLLSLKAGVADRVELRFSWAGWSGSNADGDVDLAAGDTSVGVKTTLYAPDDAAFAFGLLAEVSLPTGGGDATTGSVDPSLGLLWSYDVTGPADVSGTLLFSSLTDADDGRYVQAAFSAGIGFPVSDRVGGLVEYVGIFDDRGDTGPAHSIVAGLTYRVSDSVELDVSLRPGLSDAADDLVLGTGFAVRF